MIQIKPFPGKPPANRILRIIWGLNRQIILVLTEVMYLSPQIHHLCFVILRKAFPVLTIFMYLSWVCYTNLTILPFGSSLTTVLLALALLGGLGLLCDLPVLEDFLDTLLLLALLLLFFCRTSPELLWSSWYLLCSAVISLNKTARFECRSGETVLNATQSLSYKEICSANLSHSPCSNISGIEIWKFKFWEKVICTTHKPLQATHRSKSEASFFAFDPASWPNSILRIFIISTFPSDWMKIHTDSPYNNL